MSKSIRRLIANERLGFLERGREASQIVGGAAEQRPFIGRQRGGESRSLQASQNKVIERCAGPSPILDRRERVLARWMKRPVTACLGQRRPGGIVDVEEVHRLTTGSRSHGNRGNYLRAQGDAQAHDKLKPKFVAHPFR